MCLYREFYWMLKIGLMKLCLGNLFVEMKNYFEVVGF